jgi:hypothetical protein
MKASSQASNPVYLAKSHQTRRLMSNQQYQLVVE